jgi:hypothetical protein
MDLPSLFPSFNQPLKAAKQNRESIDFIWFCLRKLNCVWCFLGKVKLKQSHKRNLALAITD